jgi:carbon-monoxide dehydrogenase medium subunit
MQAFEYSVASSVAEAVSLLARGDGEARVLCGGTDLLVQMREGRRQARHLLDVKAIPELSTVTYDPQHGLRLGAAASCYAICHHPAVRAHYPGLVEAIQLIGGVQIQYRASVGGNLCNASPAADAIPALIVYSATALIAGPHGARTVPVEDFCTAPGQTVLQAGEILVAVHVPPPTSHSGAHYLRFIPRNEMDIAVVGAGAAAGLDEGGRRFRWARIALGAVAPTPLLAAEAGDMLAGQLVTPEAVNAAALMAQAAARPISDLRGTAAQRKHLSAVLVRRALEKAIERARGQA